MHGAEGGSGSRRQHRSPQRRGQLSPCAEHRVASNSPSTSSMSHAVRPLAPQPRRNWMADKKMVSSCGSGSETSPLPGRADGERLLAVGSCAPERVLLKDNRHPIPWQDSALLSQRCHCFCCGRSAGADSESCGPGSPPSHPAASAGIGIASEGASEDATMTRRRWPILSTHGSADWQKGNANTNISNFNAGCTLFNTQELI